MWLLLQTASGLDCCRLEVSEAIAAAQAAKLQQQKEQAELEAVWLKPSESASLYDTSRPWLVPTHVIDVSEAVSYSLHSQCRLLHPCSYFCHALLVLASRSPVQHSAFMHGAPVTISEGVIVTYL